MPPDPAYEQHFETYVNLIRPEQAARRFRGEVPQQLGIEMEPGTQAQPAPPKKPPASVAATRTSEGNQPPVHQFVGAAVIARLLDCSVMHVYALASAQRIPHVRKDWSVRFDLAKIKDWLENQKIAI
jgi:hypothetical protein